MTKPRAILVSVNYTDLLRVTLPYNRENFLSVCVVTDKKSFTEVIDVAEPNDVRVYATDSFYDNGAMFNKWKALEEALDVFGRYGWICLMDADVLWPKNAHIPFLEIGYLFGPMRRMAPWPGDIPPEEKWHEYPIHRNCLFEHAGYSQIFHADDKTLGKPPWHQTDWKHAGGADSFFQAKWPRDRRVRFPWHCLHLGESGKHWYGRNAPPEFTDAMWKRRQELRRQGLDQFTDERI